MADDVSATIAANSTAAHYVFTMRPVEAAAYSSLIVKRQKRYVNYDALVVIPVVGLACVGGAIVFATRHGLLQGTTLRPTLFVAAISFAIGYLLFGLAATAATARKARAVFADTRNARETFDCAFDEEGFVVKRGKTESRVAWSAVAAVEDARSIVVLWYDRSQGFFIPARAFRDNMARVSFARWASERVRAATPLKTK